MGFLVGYGFFVGSCVSPGFVGDLDGFLVGAGFFVGGGRFVGC